MDLKYWQQHQNLIAPLSLMTLNKKRGSIKHQYIGLYTPIKSSNMLTAKQLRIFEFFTRNPFQKLERKYIKQQSKEKSLENATKFFKTIYNLLDF